MFFDRQAQALFAGDHVLPQITPSIGLEPGADPTRLPLAEFMNSLSLMLSLPDALLLPAHGPVAPSVHARVDELLAFHERRLTECAAAVETGASTALQVAEILRWTRRERKLSELDQFNTVLAINETMAHLDVLQARGWLTSSTDTDTDTDTDTVGALHYARA